MQRFKQYALQTDKQHIISFSGGKDSTAIYLLALKWGLNFRAIFADTGHEHEQTLEFVSTLHRKTGGPKIEIIRADFTDRFEKRRNFIKEKWPDQGISDEKVKLSLELMRPSGNPFLDLCMLKGRFPSPKARFCTEELKSLPMIEQVMFPALRNGVVISWQGVRAQESLSRAKMTTIDWCESGAVIWRPIFRWSHDKVFDFHKEMGCDPNPLYSQGMGRVGCMPCIMCAKNEIMEIARRFPDHINRVREWERIVSDVSKRGMSTFFPADKVPFPEGYNPEKQGYYGIDQIVEWSKTSRGGRQFDILNQIEPPLCASKYGLCE